MNKKDDDDTVPSGVGFYFCVVMFLLINFCNLLTILLSFLGSLPPACDRELEDGPGNACASFMSWYVSCNNLSCNPIIISYFYRFKQQ